jgi:Uncharacterized protein conserved in bacteria
MKIYLASKAKLVNGGKSLFHPLGSELIPDNHQSRWFSYVAAGAVENSMTPAMLESLYDPNHPPIWQMFPRHSFRLREQIELADCVVAYGAWVQGIEGYAHLVEIGMASVLGKPTLLILQMPHIEHYRKCAAADEELCADCVRFGDEAGRRHDDAVYQAYWLASCLPNVTPVFINNIGEACCYTSMLDCIKSPIELQLYLALIRAQIGGWAHTQYAIGKYILDLAYPQHKLAIECDGHEYHASKEQRGHDAQRDRFLLAEGWRTARFTGSQIFKDVDGCAEEIGALLSK